MLYLKGNELHIVNAIRRVMSIYYTFGYEINDIRGHREFYRLPDDVLRTSKLAKLFLLMDCGQLTSQKGKSLDELLMDVSIDCDLIGKWVRPLLCTQIISVIFQYWKCFD